MQKFILDPWNIILCLLIVLFGLQIPQESIRFVIWVLIGVLTAGCLDFLIQYVVFHKIIFPRSALISGFIVAGILSYYEPFYLAIVFSVVAIGSKYLIRFHHRHFFNPANFSLFFATLFHLPLIWTIESNVYLIVIVGLYVVYRLKKLYHVLGFLIVFMPLIALTKTNPVLLISWFFLFIMLIEPKTSGRGGVRGVVFGGIAGMIAFLVYLWLPLYNFLVIGLFAANLCSPLLDRFKPMMDHG